MRSACATALLLTVAAIGCGPLAMTTPLPPIVDEEAKAAIDESWSKAFTPVDRLNRQELLDVLIGTTAYQLAVDKFVYVAEKQFAGGKAVMEIQVDRARPEGDHFEITVLDEQGEVVRNERYDREFVERTIQELNNNITPPPPDQQAAPELAELQAQREARWERIREFFPKDEPKPDDAEAPPDPVN
jgi:hypothetical protein